MRRPIPIAAQEAIQRQSSPDAWLGFVTITHPSLSEPIRVVSDPVDYLVAGTLFKGVVFDFRVLGDGEQAPRGQLTVPNVDRRILKALLATDGRAKVELSVFTTADFDLTVRPRTAATAPDPIYRFTQYELFDITGNAIEVSGTVMLRDPSQEPWPRTSGSQERLPALFRA